MKKILIRSIALCLALIAAVPFFTSCSNPPELDSVKDEFVALIEKSVEVNNIFFGEGLPTYVRVEGDGNLIYLAEHDAYYAFITDGERVILKYKIGDEAWKYAVKTTEAMNMEAIHTDSEGNFYYPIEFDESQYNYYYDTESPTNYDYVRTDCPYQSLEQIMALAESVYTQSYLKGENYTEGDMGYGGVYAAMFDGIALGTEISYARYRIDDSIDGFYLLKSNEFEPFFEEHKTYDYDTMKIVKPSRANLINVEITAYGRYIDYENFAVINGEHTVTLTFVKEGGEWRLDTPTY
ncbi:MAG: hypothetical protein J6S71_05225 [Clostridia bacterium]|nr:hypothetical protein [Clostridia bacterium]